MRCRFGSRNGSAPAWCGAVVTTGIIERADFCEHLYVVEKRREKNDGFGLATGQLQESEGL